MPYLHAPDCNDITYLKWKVFLCYRWNKNVLILRVSTTVWSRPLPSGSMCWPLPLIGQLFFTSSLLYKICWTGKIVVILERKWSQISYLKWLHQWKAPDIIHVMSDRFILYNFMVPYFMIFHAHPLYWNNFLFFMDSSLNNQLIFY